MEKGYSKGLTILKNFRKMMEELDGSIVSLSSGQFLVWNGKYYSITSDGYAKEVVGDWLGDHMTMTIRNNLYTLLCESNVDVFKLDKTRMAYSEWVSYRNGSYNLIKRKFYPNKWEKEWLMTSIIECNYEESSTNMPNFDAFLEQVTQSNSDLKKLIQQIFGYCIYNTTDCKHHKAFIFHGTGGTGKSTLLETLADIIGDSNVSNIEMHELSESFKRAMLYGKKVNIATELHQSVNDTAALKQIISGDSVSASFKFKDNFSFKNTAKMLFATNIMPKINDRTEGLYRRLVFIPFEYSFTANRIADKNIKSKFKEEYSSICRWALDGYFELEDGGDFIEPDICVQLGAEYRTDNDPVKQFLDECLEITNDDKMYVLKDDILNEYEEWCDKCGYKRMNASNLFKAIKRLTGIESYRKLVDKKQKYVLRGVVLINKISL